MGAKIEYAEPTIARGDAVYVKEQGIAPWTGTVTAVKPSSVSGWWADINRDDRSGTWSIRLDTTEVEKIVSPAPAGGTYRGVGGCTHLHYFPDVSPASCSYCSGTE